MDIIESFENDIGIVTISGRVDASNADILEAFLATFSHKTMNIIVDCSKMDYLSSAGMRALLVTEKLLHKENGKLSLASIQAPILNILHHANVDTYFSIFPTLAAAKAAHIKFKT